MLEPIQALNRQPRTSNHFNIRAEQILHWGYKYQQRVAYIEAWAFFAVQFQLLVILIFTWCCGLWGSQLLAITIILISWRAPFARMLRAGLIWRKGVLSLARMAALLQRPRIREGSEKDSIKSDVTTLKLEQVCLSICDKQIFEKVNFSLSSGQTLCLYAPNSAGKTALTKVLLGLYPPTGGSIMLNGTPIERWLIREWRRKVIAMSEAVPLFGRNTIDALSPSRTEKSKQFVMEVLKEWEEYFPEIRGINNKRADFNTLSLGQRRLLQALRLVVARKPLWILDEPFAGLDTNTTRQLASLLQQHADGKAVLILTSDLSTLKNTDWEGATVVKIDSVRNRTEVVWDILR